MAHNCPSFLHVYDGLAPLALKADVFRACALYSTGGVWIDDDLELVQNLSAYDAVKGSILLVHDALHWWPPSFPLIMYKDDIHNAFMISKVMGASEWLCVLQTAKHVVERLDTTVHPYAIAGPAAVGKCVNAPHARPHVQIMGKLLHGVAKTWDGTLLYIHHDGMVRRDLSVPHYDTAAKDSYLVS